jgi:hypothetical protein
MLLEFLTISFGDSTELELLKLQAVSFKYVQPIMENIGKIHIFYNDHGINNIEHIKQYYPPELQSRVSITYRDSIMNCKKSSWINQQYFKLFFCKYIQTDHYIVLDSKNHFIRHVILNDFFCNGIPKLYLNNPGDMFICYKKSLSYFGIEDPFHYQCDANLKPIGNNVLLTTTPFVFITTQVSNLINFIENKENKTLHEFFMSEINQNTATEFYLYTAYLIFSNNLDKHTMVQRDDLVITIFNDPTADYNVFEKKKIAITSPKVKIFGLHREAVKKMDNDYKQNLLNMYSNFFDEQTCKLIKTMLNMQL